jgi:hypothetical protein
VSSQPTNYLQLATKQWKQSIRNTKKLSRALFLVALLPTTMACTQQNNQNKSISNRCFIHIVFREYDKKN